MPKTTLPKNPTKPSVTKVNPGDVGVQKPDTFKPEPPGKTSITPGQTSIPQKT